MKWLLFFTLIFATGFPAMARKPATAEIYSGHITDGQGNGVEYATIVLLQDEIQKAGTTTDNKGNFTMEAKAGTYKVRLPFRRERRYRIIVAGSRRMAGRR